MSYGNYIDMRGRKHRNADKHSRPLTLTSVLGLDRFRYRAPSSAISVRSNMERLLLFFSEFYYGVFLSIPFLIVATAVLIRSSFSDDIEFWHTIFVAVLTLCSTPLFAEETLMSLQFLAKRSVFGIFSTPNNWNMAWFDYLRLYRCASDLSLMAWMSSYEWPRHKWSCHGSEPNGDIVGLGVRVSTYLLLISVLYLSS